MAKNRSRRLRKKMHIDEFQELGFSVAWRFPEGTSEEQIDKTVDDFINEVIEPNKLAFDGSGYLDTGAYGGLGPAVLSLFSEHFAGPVIWPGKV